MLWEILNRNVIGIMQFISNVYFCYPQIYNYITMSFQFIILDVSISSNTFWF